MAMVTDALGMKKNAIIILFSAIYYFMFDKLENNFLLYIIISTYIYLHKYIYIYNVNV